MSERDRAALAQTLLLFLCAQLVVSLVLMLVAIAFISDVALSTPLP